MILFIQTVLYLIFFTAAIKLLVLNDPVRGIFFYPKEIQTRVFEMGLTTREEANRRRAIFFTLLVIGGAVIPVIFIGVWSGISDFRTAFIHILVLLEAMNWYDGIFVDEIWVRFSKFWVIKGVEDISPTKKISFALAERLIMTVVYIPAAAGLAKIAVMI
ncbi:MAG: hypothetical protein NC120_05400 [Ruminococcus sp.]|nr:hypothetical protein [Ruminococcus sp.]